ncbi:PqqD family protein [Candidatus Micrarchaeota archaeon]|nr:PqqD family protein [Candidatus Micrarchaeota archaeon]
MPYSKNPNLIEKDTDTGLLIFDTRSGRMMELNATAKLLWKKSNAKFEAEDLKKIIQDNCVSVKNLEADLADFIKNALKHGLVSENGED